MEFESFLGKESLAALGRMGFGKREARLGPHRYHGVAARTRLSVAGKVNDLAEITREIDSFTSAGKRIPVAVWEKYDRINKRHKKHDDMMAIAAEARIKIKRRTRKREEQGQAAGQGCTADSKKNLDGSDQKEGIAFSTDKSSTGIRRHHPLSNNPSSSSSFTADSTELSLERMPKQRTAPSPFQGGGRCTFGSGRGEEGGDALETLARREAHASTAKSRAGPSSSSWGPQERDKLNEICESDCSNQRLSFPNTSSCSYCCTSSRLCAVVQEPNEREHWLKLNAKRGFFPQPQQKANAAAGSTRNDTSRVVMPAATTEPRQPLDFSSLASEPQHPAATNGLQKWLPAGSEEEPLFRRSGGGGSAPPCGGRLVSAAAAAYTTEAKRTAFLESSPSRRLHASLRASGTPVSPFHDPVRPNSPAWGFGEAPPVSPRSSRPGSRGSGRSGGGGGGGSRGSGGGSRGVSRGAQRGLDDNAHAEGVDDGGGHEETELLDYTSLGVQTISSRATSPAFGFARDGLGSENLSMFQADKRPEPGPGSFCPNLSSTSTHPGVRCGVLMGGRLGSRGGGGGDEGGGKGCHGGTGGGSPGGVGGSSTRPSPGPGQYMVWDAIGRQILSTRPSSPVVTFASGDWDLRQ
ncbi:unnamed protein product [Ectocarpus sp. CCAP 1310/34]|nr:unnamed protein product [Ectocarpus sp. CCAP 1310/34]